MAALRSCAVLETLIFFIIFARCASTVLTLILKRWAISLFLNPVQISSRISCSRMVRASGRLLRGGSTGSGETAFARLLVILGAVDIWGLLHFSKCHCLNEALGPPALKGILNYTQFS